MKEKVRYHGQKIVKYFVHCPRHRYWFTGIQNCRLIKVGVGVGYYWFEGKEEMYKGIAGFRLFEGFKKITKQEYETPNS